MNYHSISDGILDEHFVSLGMPKNLAKTLKYISEVNSVTSSKKDKFCLCDDDYNVFVYDTCKYPPNSDSHKTLN